MQIFLIPNRHLDHRRLLTAARSISPQKMIRTWTRARQDEIQGTSTIGPAPHQKIRPHLSRPHYPTLHLICQLSNLKGGNDSARKQSSRNNHNNINNRYPMTHLHLVLALLLQLDLTDPGEPGGTPRDRLVTINTPPMATMRSSPYLNLHNLLSRDRNISKEHSSLLGIAPILTMALDKIPMLLQSTSRLARR